MLHIALSALLVSIIFNLLSFAIAYKRQTDKLTDISYAITFVALSIFAITQSSKEGLNYLALLMVLLWAIRLGGFLLYRVSKAGRDSRFDEMRKNFPKFFLFWLLQGVTVWVLMLPVLALSGSTTRITIFTVVGFFVWLLGLAIETVADYQKLKFSQNPKNHGVWIDTGLWHYSRHPNYFGEILVWIGLYLLVVSSLTTLNSLISLASPLYTTGLLVFVSGIPILEKSADKKWGHNKSYLKYKQSTSLILILPKR